MRSHSGCMFDNLEQRVLLSSGLTGYEVTDFEDLFDIDPLIAQFAAPQGTAGYGAAAAALGDVSGDGVPDFAIAAPGATGNDPVNGRVFVYSGATRELLLTIAGDHPGFGRSLAAADLTGDGVNELIVGSPRFVADQEQVGRIAAFSAQNGSLIGEYIGDAEGALLGWSLAVFDSFEGASGPVIAAGAPGEGGGDVVGSVVFLSGTGLSPLATVTSDGPGDAFGWSVAAWTAAGGKQMLLAGAPFDSANGTERGRADLVDPLSGDVLWSAQGLTSGVRFGWSLAVLGGEAPRFYVGAPETAAGAVAIYSRPAGAGDDGINLDRTIFGQQSGDRFGWSLAASNDFTQRQNVLLVGAPGAGETGRVLVYPSAVTQVPAVPVHVFSGTPGRGAAGVSIALLGDVDSDGFNDLFIGYGSPVGTVSGRAEIAGGIATWPIGVPVAASDDFSWIAGELGVLDQGSLNRPFLLHDGALVPPSHIPGGHTDAIVAVNNSGVLLRAVRAGDAGLVNAYLVIDSQAVPFSQLISTVQGAPAGVDPDVSLLHPAALSNAGHVAFILPAAQSGAATTAWLYHDGVLTYLWEGLVNDVNDSGVAVGVLGSDLDNNELQAVMWSPGAGVSQLDGLYHAGAINAAGQIAGADAAGRPALWSGGSVTVFTDPSSSLPARPAMINDRGDIAGVRRPQGQSAANAPWIVPAGEQRAIPIVEATAGLLEALFGSNARGFIVGLDDQGALLLSTKKPGPSPSPADEVSGYLLTPITSGDHLTPDETGAVVIAAGFGFTVTAFVDEEGQAIVLETNDVTGVTTWTRLQEQGAPPEFSRFISHAAAWHSPVDDTIYVALRSESDGVLAVFARSGPGQWVRAFITAEPLDAANKLPEGLMTPMVMNDGAVVLAGRTPDGDLGAFIVRVVELDPPQPGTFVLEVAFTNLYDIFRSAGAPTPEIAGNMTTYVTAWNGANIGFLDQNGRYWVAWTGGGIEDWHIDDLSALVNAPSLTGNLTAYVAPWHAMHIAGTDESGRVHVIWWAPDLGPGNWVVSDLTAAATAASGSAPLLEPGSLTAYVTPWGGLNVAGVNLDTGTIWVYWWAPDQGPGNWRIADMSGVPGDPQRPTSRLTSLGGPDGTLNIAGVSDDGEVIRLYWFVEGDLLWRARNLSQAAVL